MKFKVMLSHGRVGQTPPWTVGSRVTSLADCFRLADHAADIDHSLSWFHLGRLETFEGSEEQLSPAPSLRSLRVLFTYLTIGRFRPSIRLGTDSNALHCQSAFES